MDEFEHQKSAGKATIPDQFDIAGDLLYGVLVISGELPGDANQPWRTPIDVACYFSSQLFHHQPLKLLAMVQQPVKVKQSLIDNVLIHRSLEFDTPFTSQPENPWD